MKKKIEKLEKRLEELEHIFYRKWIKDCPRCNIRTMNELQPGVCKSCAYTDYDEMEKIKKSNKYYTDIKIS